MPSVAIQHIAEVGPSTLAITLAAPEQFDAYPGQFILVRADIDGEEVTGYYTLSSPSVDEQFEITVTVDPEGGTLGPWLAEREPGDAVEFDGPFGDIYYEGGDDVSILASGPGIGPAVAIGERAEAAGRHATVLYLGDEPVHENRLAALQDGDASVELFSDMASLSETLEATSIRGDVYVFGFAEFVEEARTALEATGVESERIHVESFGPE